MISIIIILLLFAFNQYSCQSISGSSSACGPRPKPVACGKGVVLRGQSHIGIPAACFLTVDPGPCSQDMVRIYYDHKTYTCKAFSYSGCGGNANRFVSVKNCYKLCHPYYRQRFIGLGADNAVTAKPNPKYVPPTARLIYMTANGAPGDAYEESRTTSSPIVAVMSHTNSYNVEIINYSGVKANDTDHNDTLTHKNSTNFAATEEPEVQVIHEYDTFMPSPQLVPQTRSGLPPGPPPYGYPPNYPSQYPQSKNKFLQNIQHSDYNPVGGYIKTQYGYRPQPIQSQQAYYANYK